MGLGLDRGAHRQAQPLDSRRHHPPHLESASVPVCNQTTYRASAWIRAEKLGEGSARIYVACYDEQGKWTGTVVSAALAHGAVGWQQVEAIVPTGKLPEKTAVARVNLSLGKAPEGSAWFDDVQFHAMSQ